MRTPTWYDSSMPTELPKDAIDAAEAAVLFARAVRRQHRRRTARNQDRRVKDIEAALARLREAMKPLKSEIGRFPYGPQTTIAEKNRDRIREASASLQVERRKLHKMLPKAAS